MGSFLHICSPAIVLFSCRLWKDIDYGIIAAVPAIIISGLYFQSLSKVEAKH